MWNDTEKLYISRLEVIILLPPSKNVIVLTAFVCLSYWITFAFSLSAILVSHWQTVLLDWPVRNMCSSVGCILAVFNGVFVPHFPKHFPVSVSQSLLNLSKLAVMNRLASWKQVQIEKKTWKHDVFQEKKITFLKNFSSWRYFQLFLVIFSYF